MNRICEHICILFDYVSNSSNGASAFRGILDTRFIIFKKVVQFSGIFKSNYISENMVFSKKKYAISRYILCHQYEIK